VTYAFRQFYIDGRWVDPAEPKDFEVVNPATERVASVISMGGAADVGRAVTAARRAFDSYSMTTPAERRALLERILAAYETRYGEFVAAITEEMGAPVKLARDA
jgi:aldehyde dehydrogenase (NAD+)